MKKLFVVLVGFAVSASIYAADVDFSAADNGHGTVTITYTVNSGTIRCMALDVDADVYITDVAVDSFFDVFMDSAYMDPDNYYLAAGTPIAFQDQVGEFALPSNSFCISMGNLEGVATANEIVLQVNGFDFTFTLDINHLRGGVINTDGQQMTTNLPIVSIYEVFCWDYPCFEKGDSNGDGAITAIDVQGLLTAWGSYDECADFNKDGAITAIDVQILLASWGVGCN